jgi:biopolymer transport protein ExbD
MIRRPKHELPVIPTANLVDIAILLIIFYMACSNFLTSTGKITPPKAPELEKVEEPVLSVAVDQDGVIFLQGHEAANAAAIESVLKELLRERNTDKARTVMFKCDANVKRQVYQPVLDAIVEAGGLILAVGDKGEKERASPAGRGAATAKDGAKHVN